MYGFAVRGRWLVGLVLVLVAVAVCVRLGIWQLDRRDERLAFNDLVASRGELPPIAIDRLVRDAGDDERPDHRRVEVAGRYDPDHELLVWARSYQGRPGMHVVTPLVTDEGHAVLVNRGFVPLTDPTAPVPEDAKPSDEPVEIVGVFRMSEDGARFTPATAASVREGTIGHVTRIDVERIAEQLPYELVPGFVRIEAERADPAVRPIPLPPPELGEGPHLGYALQWFTFATVFLVGWPILILRSARRTTPAPARP